MALEQDITRYELLVRFNEDGSLSGAHQKWRRVVRDTTTGEILVDQEMVAERVDPTTVADVLDEHHPAIAQQVLDLQAERDALQARVAELEGQAPTPARSTVEISMQQAIRGLMRDGWITPAEAEAWAEGVALPALIQDIIAAMPAEQRAEAKVRAHKSTTIRRDSDLLVAAASAAMPDATPEERAATLEDSFGRWAQL